MSTQTFLAIVFVVILSTIGIYIIDQYRTCVDLATSIAHASDGVITEATRSEAPCPSRIKPQIWLFRPG
jgi:hypothetical protein